MALKAPVAPIVPAGESSLIDGVTVSRADSIVTVSFDTPMIRTRIPEKFERFVRSTLPLIYGAGVDSALATIPMGEIAGQGNLFTELPARGLRIPLARHGRFVCFRDPTGHGRTAGCEVPDDGVRRGRIGCGAR
jgi:hypothetical protein